MQSIEHSSLSTALVIYRAMLSVVLTTKPLLFWSDVTDAARRACLCPSCLHAARRHGLRGADGRPAVICRRCRRLRTTLSPARQSLCRLRDAGVDALLLADDVVSSATRPTGLRRLRPRCQSANLSFIPSIIPSIIPPIIPTISSSINPSVSRSVSSSINPLVDPQSVNPSIRQPANPSIRQSVNPPIRRSFSHSANPSHNWTIGPSIRQSVS